MPHAVDSTSAPTQAAPNNDTRDVTDDNIIAQILGADPSTEISIPGLDPNKPLDVGEKADDAVDYEDFSDDDLPDEEDAVGTNGVLTNGHHTEANNLANGAGLENGHDDHYEDDDLDDLFGDDGGSPVLEKPKPDGHHATRFALPRLEIPSTAPIAPRGIQLPGPSPPEDAPGFRAVDYAQDESEAEEEDEMTKLQRRLIAQARKAREEIQEEDEDNAELLATLWPQFDPDDIARFSELFQPKKAFYVPKTPSKPPKPIQPTKVSLEIQQDQEKTFRLTSSGATQRANAQELERNGLILIARPEDTQQEQNQDVELEELDESEKIGGLTMEDLTMLCQDWDIDVSSSEAGSSPDMTEVIPNSADWETPPQKRRRAGERTSQASFPINYEAFPSLDDPEATTALLSRKVPLDLNDPKMLIDVQKPDATAAKTKRPGGDFRKDISGSLTKSLSRKYNISNDDAYDLLKENHSHKVRSTLSNLTVEHGTPALKLQYPFYKVKLSARDSRSFHRPALAVKPQGVIKFNKIEGKKRKLQRTLTIQQAYSDSKDLSLNDNSFVSLFEYSEEYPMMMSNFGMGSKLVNYYRRKDEEDASRPKYDLGDTHVLLPQDKSPFSIFGSIPPGEHQPTLHNTMFRAPVWQHNTKGTDFIVGRSSTGLGGQNYYLRNVQNVFVVGQQLPSVDIPGTHSRKVTDAAKRRLKMISWRIHQKHQRDPRRNPALTNEIIREHLPGSEIPQNRSKMREFMSYHKDKGIWVPGEDGKEIAPPDYASIRRQLKPEDVCLLDSMQVGHRHLLDSGYNEDGKAGDDDDAADNENDSLEQQLAPWQLTKNFLNACQSKAMLQLYGPGDPSGRGEAFSFIKTSMKGGFKAAGESVQAKLDAKKLKELGGHSYNVAQQQREYEASIRKIWDAQKRSLGATDEDSDNEMDMGDDEEDAETYMPGRTPRSDFGTPAAISRREDDSASQFSRFSASNAGKVLKITHHQKDKYGKDEIVEEIVHDPRVIRAYTMRRKKSTVDALRYTTLISTTIFPRSMANGLQSCGSGTNW